MENLDQKQPHNKSVCVNIEEDSRPSKEVAAAAAVECQLEAAREKEASKGAKKSINPVMPYLLDESSQRRASQLEDVLEGISPLPLQRDINHRSGIPGAFGVGDVDSFLAPDEEGPPRTPPENNAEEESYSNLARANPVVDESPCMEDLPRARPHVESSAKSTTGTIKLGLLGIGLCLLVAGISIGTVCGSGVSCPSIDEQEGAMPMQSSLLQDFKSRIEQALGENYLAGQSRDSFNTRTKALEWIVYDDPLQLEPDAPNLLQRYILALFYYETSREGAWKDCNPPNGQQSDTCYYTHLDSELLASRWLSATNECFWAGIICSSSEISEISLADYRLSGPIPTEISLLASLSRLDFNLNDLSGPIPTEIFHLGKQLKYLGLSSNGLTGSIPEEMFELLHEMDNLNLRNNSLTGTIPSSIQHFQGDRVFLDSNKLSGPIPPQVYSLANLRLAWLGGNYLSGTIPTEVGNLQKLELLFLGNSRISGTIPSEIAMLNNALQYFVVHNSKLGGTIPEEIYGLTNLKGLDLEKCAFSGTLDTHIGKMTSLRELLLSGNDIHGTIPSQISSLSWLGGLTLNGNDLDGTVPCSSLYSSFQEVAADCAPDEDTRTARVECDCCTLCCQSDTKICLAM